MLHQIGTTKPCGLAELDGTESVGQKRRLIAITHPDGNLQKSNTGMKKTFEVQEIYLNFTVSGTFQ